MRPITKKEIGKCFIIMPISTPDNWLTKYSNDNNHFKHVLEHLLIPSLEKVGLDPITPSAKGSEVIHGNIIKNIELADLVLCDMSILNPNVFFELGIRIAINKPICLIKDDITNNVPFDTAIINCHNYLSALNPWTLEKEIDDLANHIKESFDVSKGSNSLWEYFSLSSAASPIEPEHSVEGKIDFLTRQIEALREQLIKEKHIPPLTKDREFREYFDNRIRQIVSPTGAFVEYIEHIGAGQIKIALSEELDAGKYAEVIEVVKKEFPGIKNISWDIYRAEG